jgi:hypothetical protein
MNPIVVTFPRPQTRGGGLEENGVDTIETPAVQHRFTEQDSMSDLMQSVVALELETFREFDDIFRSFKVLSAVELDEERLDEVQTT